MISSIARGVVRGALALAVAATVTAAGATAAQAATPRLSLTALAFENSTVDATSGSVVDDLTWTIKNTDPDADGLSGSVTLRMRSSITGAYVGHETTVKFEYDRTCCNGAEYVSGTPQESTYRYSFVVPRWADATSATWEVTNVSAVSEGVTLSAGAGKLAGFASKVTAATSIDASGPSLDQLELEQGGYPGRPYLYVADGAKYARYSFWAQDQQSGFWKGTIKLAGPGGQSITTPFTWDYSPYSTGTNCGSVSGGDLYQMACNVDVTLPVGAAAGSWRVAQMVLFNNAGARSTYKNPQSTAVTVTSNAVMTASGFAIDPVEADNWRKSVDGTVSFQVAGARKGISSVLLDFDTFSCGQRGNLAVSGDTVSIPFVMYDRTEKCTVTGIAVIDGAGDVSLYGSRYGAPEPGLTVRRKASTTPPVVTGAALDVTSVPASEAAWTSIGLTIQAQVLTAPIDEITLYMYDSAGTETQLSFGGTSQAADGSLQQWVSLPYWQEILPGTYTIGFKLADEGGLSSKWGMVGDAESHDIPGGPLSLTVTEG
ncbi:hypothetical protein Q0Z83_089980 [Actinoplanes sichuanensis]|uniref:Uncharacterized protein n=1 Tax=Actinoplanes sichuanensis TaxID=512349 RepID=A0ABW4AKM3_9ACTN|nr:hypothetical protein [Actinoplanes sichuanensis]BEL10807.1 hypothetical protein Q0Z83_089980 [Actinoplanes sichuanensis]